jgi:hypothetical protein
VRSFKSAYGAALYAMERYMRGTGHPAAARVADLRNELDREAGVRARIMTHALGPVLAWAARREARRYPAGRRLEPRTWVDRRHWHAAS